MRLTEDKTDNKTRMHIEGSKPEWCISTVYDAWDTHSGRELSVSSHEGLVKRKLRNANVHQSL